MKKWEKFSEEELLQFVKESRSYRDLAIKCGYAPDGGSSIAAIKEMVKHFNFDISHFTGQGWNKANYNYDLFAKDTPRKPRNMINALIALRGQKCERCGLTEWLDQPIKVEVHHIDGDGNNNELTNLQLLCPNCHSLTDNWKGKNNGKNKMIPDEEFAEALKSSPNIRQALLKLGITAKGANYTRARELIHEYNIEHLF